MKKHGMFFLIGMFVLSLTAGAMADTIHLQSAPSMRFIKITSFKEGKIETFSSTDGKRTMIPYADIAIIRVDGQPELNDAERLMLTKKYDAAIKGYQKVLDKTHSRDSWMSVWSQVRLVNLLASEGQMERAVEIYINLAKAIPDWVLTVSPTKKDFKGTPAQLGAAADKLLHARDESKNVKVRDALGKFYQRFGRERPLPALKDINTAELDEANLAKYEQPGPWFDTWSEEKIKARKYDLVLQAADRLAGTSLRRNLPAVFYWRGQVFLAKEEFDKAALEFMEIAVEFPSSEYAARGLFYAAQAATETGRLEYARKLWRELIDNFTNSNDYQVILLVEKARDFLRDKEK